MGSLGVVLAITTSTAFAVGANLVGFPIGIGVAASGGTFIGIAGTSTVLLVSVGALLAFLLPLAAVLGVRSLQNRAREAQGDVADINAGLVRALTSLQRSPASVGRMDTVISELEAVRASLRGDPTP